MKTLVAYFSAEHGRTAGLAEALAEITGADLFEIRPEQIYTKADLKYMNPLARCNREWIGKKDVPVRNRVEDLDQYDMVLIGFPIWYAVAPNVINTFCRDYDFTGKKVALFATSGGSGIGKTKEKLQPYVNGTEIIDGRVFKETDPEELKAWVESLG